jgi:hypothetical protein
VNDDVNLIPGSWYCNHHLFFVEAGLFFATNSGKFECILYLSFTKPESITYTKRTACGTFW